ncbi:uncharacterized protein LOC134841299 [Symsagittifera roscoffensis]|uniref:uncharacterized protein LOC134841299 n=1 Tax=Symsagittifera roscoffensis TaxID=84072 RepID=UPI00307B3FF4
MQWYRGRLLLLQSGPVGLGGVHDCSFCGLFRTGDMHPGHNTLQQNYQSCELRYVVTDNDLNSAPVTRGCSSNVCSDQAAGVLVCDVNGNVQTCTICCSSGANCNTFSGIVAAGKDQVMPNIVALMVPLVMMLVMAMKEHN